MKRLIAILMILACVLSAPVAAYAANEEGEYSDIEELYQYWEMNGYPDYAGGVFSDSDSIGHLTVLLVNDDGTIADQIRDSLVDDSGVSFGKAEFSYNALKEASEDISANYMGSDEKIYSVGVGWTSADGVVTGFGESGKEFRVVVTVDESVLTEYEDKFHELYGDMVVVEAGGPFMPVEDASAGNVWLLPLMIFIIMIAGAGILFNRSRLIPAMQTTKGTVVAQSAPVSRKETITAVKNSEIAPSDKVFDSILRKIDKNDG